MCRRSADGCQGEHASHLTCIGTAIYIARHDWTASLARARVTNLATAERGAVNLKPQALLIEMMLSKAILFLLILSRDCQGWWSSSRQPSSDAKGNSKGGNSMQSHVKFEVLSAEDKFLAQAKQYMDLSPLDLCHQKVKRGWIKDRRVCVSL